MKFISTISSVLLLNLALFGQVGNPVWEDNFNQGQLDLSKWNIETGTGVNGDWGTGQIDRARAENVTFQNGVSGADDGCLVITTKGEFHIDRNYTSGRINTAGKASWGPGHRIEAKVYPRDVKYKGQGFAFWMMPDEIPTGWSYIMWPQGGEIDIMEYVGSIPYHNLGSVHYAWYWEDNQWQSWNHGHQGAYYSYEAEEVPDPAEPGYGAYPPPANAPYAGSSGFHNYGINWYTDRIEFFVDSTTYHIHYLNDGDAFQADGQDGFAISNATGKRVATSEYSNHFEEWYPYEHKMYFILSAGVGGSQNTYGGEIVPEAEFPCSVFIDWVRVYELENIGINEIADQFQFNLYPNPSSEILNIQLQNPTDYSVKIIDLSGRTVIHTSLDQSTKIDVSGLEAGTYLVIVSKAGFTMSRKIVLQ
ncbi:MAG: T9SS type A sorting domain-containing protein [Bacteroidales bacterium]|nr:T9SS type A sorting domain-containing protein [Bacteroidales bacterium]MCF8454354.1 T9SS type A sorting domain-containing protein [Bacteroidales bacterium]